MKKIILAILLFTSFAMAPFKKTKVVFFGDSITQMGIKPGGYIDLIQTSLNQKNLQEQYELIGAGVSGNKIYDLYLRIEEDVLAKQPDVVFIWVGVNDVWHKASSGTGTDADKFEKFYNAVIKKLQDQRIRVILCTPAAIGERTDNTNQQDGDLNYYSNIIRRLAKEKNCELVDLRKQLLDYNLKNNLENKEKGILTVDRVHLTDAGNRFVADAMMAALFSK
ncbi:MAG: GDSL-type esterase/lipase family protein [Chitinophagaceae bacterium]